MIMPELFDAHGEATYNFYSALQAIRKTRENIQRTEERIAQLEKDLQTAKVQASNAYAELELCQEQALVAAKNASHSIAGFIAAQEEEGDVNIPGGREVR